MPCKVTHSQVWGLGCGYPWRVIILPTTGLQRQERRTSTGRSEGGHTFGQVVKPTLIELREALKEKCNFDYSVYLALHMRLKMLDAGAGQGKIK